MLELQHPWGAYALLQEHLAHRHYVNDKTWGLEAGMNRLLAGELSGEDDVDRAVRSESRKERHRTQLRRVHLAVEDSTEDPENALEARERLRLVEAQVTAAEDWALLLAVGEGHEYEEIATGANVASGTLRSRVLRLRRTLVVLASGTLSLAKPAPVHRAAG